MEVAYKRVEKGTERYNIYINFIGGSQNYNDCSERFKDQVIDWTQKAEQDDFLYVDHDLDYNHIIRKAAVQSIQINKITY